MTTFAILASLSGFLTALHAQMPSTQAELELGIDSYEHGLYPQALKHLQQAVALDPSSISAHYYLALVSDDICLTGRCEPHTSTAVRKYQKVLELDPAHEDALKNFARLTSNIGRPEDAERLYRRAATLNPNDPEAIYSVAVLTWRRAYRDVMSEKARLGLKPRKSLIGLPSCAEVRRKVLGDVEEAISLLNKSFQLAKYDEIQTYLGRPTCCALRFSAVTGLPTSGTVKLKRSGGTAHASRITARLTWQILEDGAGFRGNHLHRRDAGRNAVGSTSSNGMSYM